MAIRALLINPNQMRPPIAPVGLDYMAEALNERGHQVSVLDLCFLPDVHQAVSDAVHHLHPQIIGVSVRNTDDCYYAGQAFVLPRVKEVVQTARKESDAPVVVGGVGFSIAPEETFRFLDADFGIEGEGEIAFCMLADRISRRGKFEEVPGLLYRQRGQLLRSLPHFAELDDLPVCSRRFVNNARYFAEGGQIGFETKRGCTMACAYCADPVAKGRTIRMRSPSKVVDELKALLDQGVDHFHTCDSEFNLPEEHAIEVCEAITRAGLAEKIRWYAYCCPTPFAHELAGAMKEAGCAGIDFGVDSGDDQMLGWLRRHFTAEDLRRTARTCREYDIPFMYDLLIGGPGETFTSVKHTINLTKEISPDCVGVAVGVRIYDGTRMAEIVRNEGPLAANPHLHGVVDDNPAFLKPIFYLSSALGPDAAGHVRALVGDDPRFFFGGGDDPSQDYNYNANELLVEAIRDRGYRGAYWDILRRLRLDRAEGEPSA